jgi:hypothetical protein
LAFTELSRDERIIDKPIPHPSKAFTLHISKSKIDHPEAGFGAQPYSALAHRTRLPTKASSLACMCVCACACVCVSQACT